MQGQEGRVAETSQSDAEENEDCDSPSTIKPGRYFDALHGPELDELRVCLAPKTHSAFPSLHVMLSV